MEDSNNGASTECKLLESALALFSEKGYEGTSIREIIERAGVTRPVLYYYFKNKEDLFCRLVETSFAELGADLDRVIQAPGSCRSKLQSIMSATFERAENSFDVVRLLLQAVFASPAEGLRLDMTKLVEGRLDRLAAVVQEGLDAGELTGGDAQSLALVFAGIMDMHIMAKMHRPQAVLTPDLANYLVDLFIQGAGGGVTNKMQYAFRPAVGARPYKNNLDAKQNRVAEK
ncbi:MAG: TetR/AcrR family transcriptional regulator [Candidatus Hydrogenedentes bacterium]|nr:TetR/AcrR family transcriptional regulator [Candidatus Hydrogenedentota bacterium]